MAFSMMTKGDGTLVIKGDEFLEAKLPEGFDVEEIDISDVRINAQALGKAFNNAECRGIEAIKRYFTIKAAFIHQQELAKLPDTYERPTVANTPAITTASLKTE
ncbi:hypothetical protein ABIA69_002721 [Lysinibacillus parviboronicapiens]|uniref:Uncharacterized protein n=1 Tax=Lysinibacillus parviboronicapiens TaxID=436516 RepID=A0ABV2PKT1_9BACI